MSTLKRSRKRFWISFSVFALISGVIILLKRMFDFPDIVSSTHPLMVISPVVFIAAVIIAYGYYDKLAKNAKDLDDDRDEAEQWKFFLKAHTWKFVLLTVGGLAISITLLFYWKKDYLYALGIIMIFYLLAYPTQLKYDQQFSHRLEKRYQPQEPPETEEQTPAPGQPDEEQE